MGPFEHYQRAFHPNGDVASPDDVAALYACVQRMSAHVRPEERREDIAATVFVKLCERAADLPRVFMGDQHADRRFKGYVRQMLKNAAIDEARTAQRQDEYDDDRPAGDVLPDRRAAAAEQQLDADAIQAEIDRIVSPLFERFPGRYRAERRTAWTELLDLAYGRADYDLLVARAAAPGEHLHTVYTRVNKRHTRLRASLQEAADQDEAADRMSPDEHKLLSSYLGEFLRPRCREGTPQVSAPARAARSPREEGHR